ncbi:MAG: tetratricopeptide repeat protein [Chitinophagales bacterium]
MKRIFSIFISAILLLFFISACKTSKNADRGFLGRSLDDLIARDNGYFNARLTMKENEKSLWEQQTDNYEEILPIFKYGTQEQASSVQPAMDEVVEKTSFVIQMHKKSKWVDDSYFLIGKANFYKRNYDEALMTFQYIVSDYSDLIEKQSKAKRVKEDEDGELSFFEKLKHQPVASEAGIWVARCLVEKKQYSDAHTVLSVLKSRENFPKWLLGELYAVEADLYIKENQRGNAIEPLMLSIENIDDKKLKVRYNFILAQLYAEQKNYDKALATYKIVLESKPSYDMDFYAKLNMAKLTMANYGVSGKETKDELLSLLKDEKYKDFYGLIYYTLADMSFNERQLEQGVEYLNLSIRNTQDAKQKGISYMRLGDLYYADVEYKLAYAYYDSTISNLPKEHERFEDVKNLRDNLKLLVDELTIIETEKKLQYWAGLSEKELEKALADILKEAEASDTSNNEILENKTVENAANTEGDFYFYNTNLRSRGFTEFKKNWGTRKLEDNWRRSDKGSFGEEEEKGVTENGDGEKTIDLTGKNLTLDAIIESLPKTPEEIAASNERIAGALYRAGIIYKENFKNKPKAVELFEENVNDYPDNNFEVQALYQLYRLTGNPKQDIYKNKLLEKYPNSDYAKIIGDPEYFKKRDEQKNALDIYYAETYDLLQEKEYSQVKTRSLLADSLFKPNPLKPQFEMLMALTYENPDSVDIFKNELQKVAIKYPQHDVGIRAQEILDYLRRGSVMDEVEKMDPDPSYNFEEDEEQYFLFVMNSTGKNATTLKNNISTFNSTNFTTDNLKISSLLLGKDNSIIMVKSFPGVETAMTYYFTIKDNAAVFIDLTKEAFTPMVISKSNYVQFFKSKDIEGYETFFQDNYLKD